MKTQTLKGSDGARMAVMFIGQEVEFLMYQYSSDGWMNLGALGYKDIVRIHENEIEIRVPLPTIEDLKVGDIVVFWDSITDPEDNGDAMCLDEGDISYIKREMARYPFKTKLHFVTRNTNGIEVV